MDPLPQHRWAGVFITFFAMVTAACGAVRRNKCSNGRAPQCLTGPGRADDPKTWYRSATTGDTDEQTAKRAEDKAALRARLATTKGAEIAAAQLATPGNNAAIKKNILDEYVRVANDDDANRRQYLADELCLLCSPEQYQQAIKLLPASARSDGVAILLVLYDNCAPTGGIGETEKEREKLSKLIWTEPSLKRHIIQLAGAFTNFEETTDQTLSEEQKHYYLLKSVAHADYAYANHIKLLTPTLDKEGDKPYTNASRWLRDKDGDRSPNNGGAPNAPAAFACGDTAFVAPQPGCVDCGSTSHDVARCPKRGLRAWLADPRNLDDPPGGWSPRVAGEQRDPTKLSRGLRRHRERCMADPGTHGQWNLDTPERTETEGGGTRRGGTRRGQRAHFASDTAPSADGAIDAWAQATSDEPSANLVGADYSPGRELSHSPVDHSSAVRAARAAHRDMQETSELLELELESERHRAKQTVLRQRIAAQADSARSADSPGVQGECQGATKATESCKPMAGAAPTEGGSHNFNSGNLADPSDTGSWTLVTGTTLIALLALVIGGCQFGGMPGNTPEATHAATTTTADGTVHITQRSYGELVLVLATCAALVALFALVTGGHLFNGLFGNALEVSDTLGACAPPSQHDQPEVATTPPPAVQGEPGKGPPSTTYFATAHGTVHAKPRRGPGMDPRELALVLVTCVALIALFALVVSGNLFGGLFGNAASTGTDTNTFPHLGVCAPAGQRHHPRPGFASPPDLQWHCSGPPHSHATGSTPMVHSANYWTPVDTPRHSARDRGVASQCPLRVLTSDYAPLARVFAAPEAKIAAEQGHTEPRPQRTVVVVCDSGATCSCFNHIGYFHEFTQYPSPRAIGVANGQTASIVGIGTVRLLTSDHQGTTIVIELRQCRLVPSFQENLLAVIPGLSKGTVLHLESGNSFLRSAHNGAKIPVDTQGSLPVITCTRASEDSHSDSQYACHIFAPATTSGATHAAAAASAQLHCDMGHFSLRDILQCVKRGRLRVASSVQAALLRDKTASATCLCTACAQAKLHATPVNPSKVYQPRPDAPSANRPGATRCCQRWSIDFMDVPHAVRDRLGNPAGHTMRHGLVAVDHYSGQIMVHFVKSVTDAPAALKHLIDQCHARGLITDLNNCNLELTADTQLYNSCAAYCDAHGILRRAVSAGDHRFNRAESAIRTLRLSSEAMRFHAQLPGCYAPAAVCYAAHIANMLGRRSRAYVSPYEAAFGFVPDASSLIEFGSVCAVLVDLEQNARGDPRAVFALSAGVRQSHSGLVGGFPDVSKDRTHVFFLPGAPGSPRHSRNFKQFHTGLDALGRETIVLRLNLNLPPGRSARKQARADILAELAARAAADAGANHVYAATHARVFVPRSHHQATRCANSDKWMAAETKEVVGQLDKGTWEVTDHCDRDQDAPVLQMIMAYKYKHPTTKCPDGVFKARCCPDGSQLTAGQHYGQYAASSPVADRASVRTLLALCCMRCLKLECLDLEQAYLQQRLPEDQIIYVRCPPGHTTYGADRKPQLWRALKPCYGLPWAGQALYESLTDWLRRIGARPTAADPCVWSWSGAPPGGSSQPVGELLCAITVDDIIFGGSNKAINALFISKMKSQFKLTHDANVERVLGLDIVERDNGVTRTIAIDTEQLIEDLAADHDLSGLPPVDNPSPSNPSYHDWQAANRDEAAFYLENKRYRALTGSLTYIATVGRPDIAHAAAMVCRHNHNPGPKAFAAAKRVVAYLLATKNNKLTYSGPARLPIPWDRIGIKIYVDSDHQGADEKSQTGMATFLVDHDCPPHSFCGGAVDWASKRQGCLAEYPEPPNPIFAEDDSICVAGHSSDAELIALSDAVPRGRHHRLLLREMGATQPAATKIYSDSLPAIKFVHSDTSPSLKHMNARVRQIREMLRLGVMAYHHLPGSENNSDALTKRLTSAVFGKHARTLMGVDCAARNAPTKRDE